MTGTALPQAPQYNDAVDLDRYPINDPASLAYQDLVQACREQLRSHGVAQLYRLTLPRSSLVSLPAPTVRARPAWLPRER